MSLRAETRRTSRTSLHRGLPLLLSALCLAAGCSRSIENEYGRSRGIEAATSVNGTGVLMRLFEEAGHRTYAWGSFSPRLHQRADCIVWFPVTGTSPSESAREWLEDWLLERGGRTLVIVLCDYDAEPGYWRKIRPQAPVEQQPEIDKRLEDADLRQRHRHNIDPPLNAEWFEVHEADSSGRATTLAGDPFWLDGIDPAKTEIEVRHRLVAATDSDTLLECEHGELVTRLDCGQGQILVVANGSFLLNLALVNHEHRKLAARLIDEVGASNRQVAFLESYWGEPPIRDKDPSPSSPIGLEILTIWPTNWILLHLIAAGLIFCFSRWPIFGPPRDPEPEPLSDFGKHVAAVAEHLKRTGQPEFAEETLTRYRLTSNQP